MEVDIYNIKTNVFYTFSFVIELKIYTISFSLIRSEKNYLFSDTPFLLSITVLVVFNRKFLQSVDYVFSRDRPQFLFLFSNRIKFIKK